MSMDEAGWFTRRTIAMRDALSSLQAALQRLEQATGASALDPAERIAGLRADIRAAHAIAWDAVAADQRAVYDYTHQDHLEPPWAPGNVGASRPVGLEEISSGLGVTRKTVDKWRERGVLPPPTWTVSGRPLWKWLVIEEWARATRRLRG